MEAEICFYFINSDQALHCFPYRLWLHGNELKNATGNATGQGLMRETAEHAITLIIIAAIPVRFEAMNDLSQDFEQK